jgi:hypothetical protein
MPFDGTEYQARDNAIRKLDQVIELLSSSDRWCKGALYRLNKQRCILGALQAVGATTELRRPVLEAICQVTGRPYRHIETFNDARATTHPLVMQVLYRTRDNLSLGQHPANMAATKPGVWERIKRLVA